jgi:pimeloyl-ACP methyl ester carboxylesterase
VIVGEYDTAGTQFACEKISQGIPGARREVMPGTAHLPPMEKPLEFNRLVLDFLSSLS